MKPALKRFGAVFSLSPVPEPRRSRCTDATLGTIVMARQASRLGILDQIIGRMITAGPGAISWLSRDEIVALAGPYGVAADY